MLFPLPPSQPWLSTMSSSSCGTSPQVRPAALPGAKGAVRASRRRGVGAVRCAAPHQVPRSRPSTTSNPPPTHLPVLQLSAADFPTSLAPLPYCAAATVAAGLTRLRVTDWENIGGTLIWN